MSEEIEVTPPTPSKKSGKRGPKPKILEEQSIDGEKTPPKKPGRRKKVSDEAKSKLAQQIQGIHLVSSKITGTPELELSEGEAQALAESVLNIASEYDLNLDGKTGAWVQLLGTAAFIYAPRMIAVKRRVIAQQEQAQQSVNE